MKNLAIAFMAALLACIGITLTLSALGVGKDVAGASATALFGTVPFLRDSLDRIANNKSEQSRHLILPIGSYALPNGRLLLYGVLMQFGIMEFSSAIAGVPARVIGAIPTPQALVIGATFALIVNIPAMFLIGRWVGRRAAMHGAATVIGIAAIARLLATAIDFGFAHGNITDTITEFFGSKLIASASGIGLGILTFGSAGLLGYWRGTRQRLGSYINYLLKNVSNETRKAIVDLAFEEAERERRQLAEETRSTPVHGISIAPTPG